jgi:hypothetical protein
MAAAACAPPSTGTHRGCFAADADFLGMCQPSGLGGALCVDQGPRSGRCATQPLNRGNDDLGMNELLGGLIKGPR